MIDHKWQELVSELRLIDLAGQTIDTSTKKGMKAHVALLGAELDAWDRSGHTALRHKETQEDFIRLTIKEADDA